MKDKELNEKEEEISRIIQAYELQLNRTQKESELEQNDLKNYVRVLSDTLSKFQFERNQLHEINQQLRGSIRIFARIKSLKDFYINRLNN